MKTAIWQCLQQFSSKNSKNFYHDQSKKKITIIVPLRNCKNVLFNL